MNYIDFQNEQDIHEIDETIKDTIKRCIDATLKYEKKEGDFEISVTFTDNENIKVINNNFRGINKETDVLSFPINEKDEPFEINLDTKAIILGDIIISMEKAYSQSMEYGHSFIREVAFLTVHSMLHLLFYDHIIETEEKIMVKKQEEILNILNITR